MVGVFFQSFLPSSMTVEIVKGYQLSKITDGKKAYGSVIFGKIMGISVLFLFFLFIVIFKPEIILKKDFMLQIVWGMTVFFCILGIIFSKKVSRFLFGRFNSLFKRPFFKKIKDFREELYNYRYNFKTLILAGITSVIIFLGSILATYFSFKAVFFNIPFSVCIVYVPVIYMLMMMPISINGIGLREGLMLIFFGPWNLSPKIILSSSLLAYGAIYSFCIIGGLVYMFGDIKGVKGGKEKE